MKKKQDDFCARALAKDMEGGVLDEDFPEELEWESLVDLLRGKIKLNVHCYESTDLDAFVRHTNEFKFPVAAFHHAHETFMVPDLLKTAWNNTPAVAIFATKSGSCLLLLVDRLTSETVHGTSERRGAVPSTRPRSTPRTTSPSL